MLGHVIKAGGGERDGEQVLDILATHPSTARFIATKLARRFVSDTPPPALVDRAAARFRETDGDLREVMRTILTSPEFLVARRVPREGQDAVRVRRQRACARPAPTCRTRGRSCSALQQLGMPLYQCQPPTGYKDTADAWVNTGALVSRMNFALALASGKHARRRAGRDADAPPSRRAARRRRCRDTDARDDREGARARRRRSALTLGSPEFQTKVGAAMHLATQSS